jgi:hypothetical protein
MKLSEAREGTVIMLGGKDAIVLSRTPEDRTSGSTTVAYCSGSRQEFYWDQQDPDVAVIGYGRLESKIVIDPPALFQEGDFTLRSGKKSRYKIECDALGERDWAGIAAAIMEEKLLPTFRQAIGVPRGGVPFAKAMNMHAKAGAHPILICEDIVTTGGSMERFRQTQIIGTQSTLMSDYIGVVFIARGKCPDWVTPLLQMRLPPGTP